MQYDEVKSAVPATPAQIELKQLDGALATMIEAVSNMELRLVGVMRAQNPAPRDVNGEPEAQQFSQLVSQVRSARFTVEELTRRVSVILQRLDV